MNCLLLNPEDERWLDFASSNSQANIFHHPAWQHLLSSCYGYAPFVLVVHDDTGEICAGLPLMEINSWVTGRRWVSLPFTDYCAPLSRDDESLTCLTNWIINAYQDKQAPRIELRWEFPQNEMILRSSDMVVHTIELNADPDLVAKGLKRTHRQNIRTAEKRGVRVERGDQIEHLRMYYELQLETRRRHGVPAQPWRFFKCLAHSLFEPGLGFVLLAYKDDECLAGIVFLHWQKTITAKYAASRTDSWKLRPNNLLFWSGIQWGCENGYTMFDFGRTEKTDSGLRRYKKGWGAVERPLVYSMLSENQPQGTNAKMENIMQNVIRKSPPIVCQVAGELLYKHFA